MNSESKISVSSALDLIGTVAVVCSMLLLAFNVSRSSTIMAASNENFLYKMHEEMFADEATEPPLAEVMWRAEAGLALSPVQEHQLKMHLRREVNMWEIAYYRSLDGLMADGAWDDWDRAFSGSITKRLPKQFWDSMKFAYGEDFAAHVDEQYAREAE